MTELAGRTVVITGASRGLGRALAFAFAARGARLSLCARSEAGLMDLARELEARGTNVLAEALDVSDYDQVGAWAEWSISRLGAPEVLINNASLLGPRTPLLSIRPEEWDDVLAANLSGTFNATRAFAPFMVEQGSGSIINVSSGASLPPRVNWGAYAISKTAVDALSANLAAELAGTGVRVNIVDPGAMRTEMRADAYPAEDPAKLKEADSITSLFLWLADGSSCVVTGQRFQADEWLRRPH